MLPKGETVQRARRFIVELVTARGESDVPDTFEQVLAAERAEIADSRSRRYEIEDGQVNNDPDTYVGLALSGGGIRSATFSLGVLQAMHDLGALRTVDYLSTVSGGGTTRNVDDRVTGEDRRVARQAVVDPLRSREPR